MFGSARSAGAERDRAISAFAKRRQQHADAPGQFHERLFIGGQIQLQSAGVDRAANFAGVQICHDRLARLDRYGRLGLIGAGAKVRRQHDVLQSEQRMILCRRLGRVNIDRRAGDLLFLDRFGQGDFIHHFAARIVDHQQIRPAFGHQPIAIQQMLGLIRRRERGT